MKALGSVYKEAEALTGDYQRLPAGGYVIRITQVTDLPSKEYLDVVFDIAEGEYKDFYSDEWGLNHPNVHHFFMSYKEKALGMFKGRLKAIDESCNTDFEAMAETGLQEQALVGKIVGALIGYEEYVSNQGEVKTRSSVRNLVPVKKIRSGDFKTPEFKPLKESETRARAPQPAAMPDEIPEGFTSDDSPF